MKMNPSGNSSRPSSACLSKAMHLLHIPIQLTSSSPNQLPSQSLLPTNFSFTFLIPACFSHPQLSFGHLLNSRTSASKPISVYSSTNLPFPVAPSISLFLRPPQSHSFPLSRKLLAYFCHSLFSPLYPP